jgi:DNA-3-methyladenine glycosylase II
MITAKKILQHFQQADPVMAQVLSGMKFELETPILDTSLYFERLVRTIAGQQLSGKAAESIYKRVVATLSEKITPQNIINTDNDLLRASGLSWSKVKYLNHLAEMVASKELDLTKLPKMTNSAVIAELTKVKGIGKWTAKMFLMFVLARPDVFSFGDLGLLRGLQKLYGLGEKPTTVEIETIINKWQPYKTYASKGLWHALDNR